MHRKWSIWRAVVLMCVISTCAVFSPASEIGDALSEWKTDDMLPGLVSLVWDGSNLHADALGYADLERRIPMRMDNLFWAASNGKAIACALVLTYVDEGLLGLDDPVEKFLPEWREIKVRGEVPRTKPTVRQLMGHMSGLRFFPGFPITRYPARLLAQKAVAEGLQSHPGEKYSYSNWGIDCAVAICEVLGGEPWDVLVARRVFAPLGMTGATYFPGTNAQYAVCYRLSDNDTPKPVVVDQLAYPYDKPPVYAEAGGGLFCTAMDLMKFYRMVANRGVATDGKRFLSEKVMNEWYGHAGATYTFGTTVNPETGAIGHGGAYQTTAHANWKTGAVSVFFVQINGGNRRSELRRKAWENAASNLLGEVRSVKVEGVRNR